MQKETHLEMRGVEVAVNLTSNILPKLERGLAFHDQLFVHHHVDALAPDRFPTVVDRHPHFAGYPVASCPELTLERVHVNALEEPETKPVVHLVECPDHGSSERFKDE